MREELIVPIVAGICMASLLFYMSFLFFAEQKNLFYALIIIGVGSLLSPIGFLKYMEHRKIRKMEEAFPLFMRDFVEGVRSGATIPQSIKTVASNDYGELSPLVKKMAAQMDWGIPVEKALLNFAKATKSKLIARIISSVIESHRFGGNLTDTLEALGNTAVEVERLRAERRLYLQSQLLTGYIIFIFLVVMIILQRFLIPSFTQIKSPAEEGKKLELMGRYKILFQNLITIQGFFAGLIVGKMSEGAIVAGLKHSLFMISVGLVIYLIAA